MSTDTMTTTKELADELRQNCPDTSEPEFGHRCEPTCVCCRAAAFIERASEVIQNGIAEVERKNKLGLKAASACEVLQLEVNRLRRVEALDPESWAERESRIAWEERLEREYKAKLRATVEALREISEHGQALPGQPCAWGPERMAREARTALSNFAEVEKP